MKKSDYTALDIIRKARTKLLLDYPFWGHIALNFKLIATKSVPTTAVDAKGNFYYNETWVNENFNDTNKSMTLADSIFEVAHEVGHMMFRHHARRPKGAVPQLWNLACDQIIDTHLVESGIKQSSVSRKMVTDEIQAKCKIYDDNGDSKVKTSEMRYRELEKEMEECPKCKEMLEHMKSIMNGDTPPTSEDNQDSENSDGGARDRDWETPLSS